MFGRLGWTEGCSLGMGGRGLALRCGDEDADAREDGNEAGGSANCSGGEFG